MILVVKDSVVTYLTKNASTLASRPHESTISVYGNATVQEGTYSINSTKHQGGYAAGQLEGGGYVPAIRKGELINSGYKMANGINIHAAKDSPNSDWSGGCITIDYREYVKFGVEVGFLSSNAMGKAYDTLTNTADQNINFKGYMLIDRSVLRANLKRDRGRKTSMGAEITDELYKAMMSYYFGESVN
jgi:hypothetical protein